MHPVVPDTIKAFVRESNRIEGIYRTTPQHYAAHWAFLHAELTIPNIVALVAVLQPDARLRDHEGVPGVRVGNHVAPPSGPFIRRRLELILSSEYPDPYDQHVHYETLHPFTDGNGRSGRAIWLWRYWDNPALDYGAIQRGFLHSWYYHSLSRSR